MTFYRVTGGRTAAGKSSRGQARPAARNDKGLSRNRFLDSTRIRACSLGYLLAASSLSFVAVAAARPANSADTPGMIFSQS
jgi:hypothetical protein